MKIRRITYPAILAAGLLTAAAGCTESDEGPVAPKPVIEGWIDSDGHPTVLFTLSLKPDENGYIADKMVRWGKVTVSDGEKSVVLTGTPDDRYFPPYRYYSMNICGEPGKTYTIVADNGEGLTATASCLMPCPTPIDRIEVEPTEVDTLRAATLVFTAPDDCPAYYYVSIRDLKDLGRPKPGLLGTAEALKPGAEVRVPVMHSKSHLSNKGYVPQLIRGERLEVRLNRVSREVYDFWRAYSDLVLFGDSEFVTSNAPMPTNVEGGYGIWSAQGSAMQILEVK